MNIPLGLTHYVFRISKYITGYWTLAYQFLYSLYLSSVPGYLVDNIKIDALYLGKMAYIVKIKKMKLPGPWHILSIIVSRLSTGLWKENDFIKGGNLNWNSSHSLYRLTIKPEIESSTTTKISP